MLSNHTYDIAIIGGGIVGLATAMALSHSKSRSLIVLEKEDHLAAHQTGHNSGVIHSGLYYKPGSLKARNCVEGREAMYRFCADFGIAHDNCGKLVVATTSEELPALEQLEKRGAANGLTGIRRLRPEEIREIEPHVGGLAGLFVPQTGIVDYKQVVEQFAILVQQSGGEIRRDARVIGFHRDHDQFILETPSEEFICRNLINCAGLQSDRVARMCGVEPNLQILPFRGEYYEIIPEKQELIRNLVYPVPDSRFPFLGVHFTRILNGGIEAGPNAVLAFKREGYRMMDISIPDIAGYASYSGFWRMSFKYWKMGAGEFYRSLSKSAFVHALQRLLPELNEGDVVRSGSGVRAQALEKTGSLVDDFRIVQADHMIHVLNAPSPAATASISIGNTIAEMAIKDFVLA